MKTNMKRYVLPVHDEYRGSWQAGLIIAGTGLGALLTEVFGLGFGLWWLFSLWFAFGVLLTWHQWFESDRMWYREALHRIDRIIKET